MKLWMIVLVGLTVSVVFIQTIYILNLEKDKEIIIEYYPSPQKAIPKVQEEFKLCDLVSMFDYTKDRQMNKVFRIEKHLRAILPHYTKDDAHLYLHSNVDLMSKFPSLLHGMENVHPIFLTKDEIDEKIQPHDFRYMVYHRNKTLYESCDFIFLIDADVHARNPRKGNELIQSLLSFHRNETFYIVGTEAGQWPWDWVKGVEEHCNIELRRGQPFFTGDLIGSNYETISTFLDKYMSKYNEFVNTNDEPKYFCDMVILNKILEEEYLKNNTFIINEPFISKFRHQPNKKAVFYRYGKE